MADAMSLVFYGLVCGLLAAFVPPASRAFRFAFGAGVGLIATSALPPLRELFGL